MNCIIHSVSDAAGIGSQSILNLKSVLFLVIIVMPFIRTALSMYQEWLLSMY